MKPGIRPFDRVNSPTGFNNYALEASKWGHFDGVARVIGKGTWGLFFFVHFIFYLLSLIFTLILSKITRPYYFILKKLIIFLLIVIYFFGYFLIDFFSISSLNIRVFDNWASWFFWLSFYRVILVSWFGSWVWRLVQVALVYFLDPFLKLIFSILCFNILLVGDWTL
jgi:hypothetical protein